MAKENRCLQCGAQIPADAPEGLCLRCLMKVAMSEGADVTLESPRIEGPGTTIGRYKLLELIGEGGMGLVYLAEQQEPIRRRVALKIVKLGMDTKQVIARFEAEKQMLALLDHPNIARVYDAGTTEAGRPYFVMEYVKGQSITEYCDQHKTGIEDRLKLFRQVCEGVQYAHQKGIIHRDIKPSNILVTVEGDKAVPKIIDFGIAKAVTQTLTERTLFTQQGQLLGTPEYMSPEQTDLATQDIDTRSDIYSLGVVLYQLLAGVLPFGRESFEKGGFAEIQRVIQEVDPPNPSTAFSKLGDEAKKIAEKRKTQVVPLARRLHRELEWIPLKAMRKERVRRYRSASELADDIQNYLNGNPLLAGPETAIYRVKKFVRRHAGSVATVVLVAAAIIVGLIVSAAMYFRAEQARKSEAIARNQAEQAEKVAQEQKNIAETKAEDYRRSSYVNSIGLADASYREGNISRVRELLNSCPNDLRGWEWHRINYVSDQSIMTLRGHRGYVYSAILTPDGKRIISGGSDGTIKFWDPETGADLMTLRGHEGAVYSLAFSLDGKKIASGSWDNTIKVWDVERSSEVMTLRGHKGRLYCVAFSPDGKRIVSGADDNMIKIWDAVTGNVVMDIGAREEGEVASVAFSPDGKQIVSGSWDNTIKILDAITGKEVMTLGERSYSFWRSPVSYSSDGKFIVSSIDNNIKIWDSTTGAELKTLRGHTGPVDSVTFSMDCKYIISGGMDNTIKVWETANGENVLTLRGHEGIVSSVSFTLDNKRIVSGSWDGTIKIWDVTVDHEITKLKGHHSQVCSIAFSPDGNRIVSGSMDGMVKLWDTGNCAELITLRSSHEKLYRYSVAFSPDGRYVASGGFAQSFKIWDVASGVEMVTFHGHKGSVRPIAFSPDGKYIASGSEDKTLKVWDVSSGKELMTLRGHRYYLTCVTFSPDGKHISSGSWDGIKVWDLVTGVELMMLRGFGSVVTGISFSPDGRRIASASQDGTVKIWDAMTGNELMPLKGHGDVVTSVAFSPDGNRIIAGGRDRTVRVWDAATGAELLTLHVNPGFNDVLFSPDGRTIAGSTFADAIILWESAAPAGGYGPRRTTEAARKIVDKLYEEHGFYYEVINKIFSDNVLDKSIQKLALQIANSRRCEDVDKLNNESREVVRLPDKDADAYKSALGKAQKANSLEPNRPDILTTLGVAQYRVGAYQDALMTLSRADKMRTDANELSTPEDLAFIAMSLHQLGRNEEAKTALTQLHSSFEDRRLQLDEKAEDILFEPERLFAGENTKLYSVWELIKAGRIEDAVKSVEDLRALTEPNIAGGVQRAVRWLGRVYYGRALSRGFYGPEYAEAIADYEIVVRLDPNRIGAVYNLARLRTTCPVAKLRDGTKAVEAATRACELTNWKNCVFINTLAEAYFVAGDFASAAKWQKEAIKLLSEQEKTVLQRDYEARLKLYQSGTAYSKGFSAGNLIAWWKFDEVKDGNIIDSSGNALNGKLIGDAKIVADSEKGNVLSLDDSGDYVDFGDNPAFDIIGSITLSCWIKVNKFDKGWQAIVTKGDTAWRLQRAADSNSIEFACTGAATYDPNLSSWGSIYGKADVNDGRWHHIAGVYDGTKIYLYMDGVLDNSEEAAGFIKTNQFPVLIGENAESKERYWNGLIDDVRIYNCALSEAEIKALYAGKDPSLTKESK